MEEAVKSKTCPLNNYYVRIIGTLLAITAVVSVLLAGVNLLTKPTIDRLAEEKKAQAIAEVMPGSDGFEPLTVPEGMDDVAELLLAKKGDTVLGYCAQTSTNGNDGAIELMVGIDPNGTVTSVSILSQKETMYTNKHGELIAQFAGKSGSVKLTVDDGAINAISGATITSRAVTRGVDSALAAVKAYMEGGAQ